MDRITMHEVVLRTLLALVTEDYVPRVSLPRFGWARLEVDYADLGVPDDWMPSARELIEKFFWIECAAAEIIACRHRSDVLGAIALISAEELDQMSKINGTPRTSWEGGIDITVPVWMVKHALAISE